MAARIADHFALVDADGNGSIDLEEFRNLLERLQVHRSDSVISRVFQSIDEDGNGAIDFPEFSRWWASLDSG